MPHEHIGGRVPDLGAVPLCFLPRHHRNTAESCQFSIHDISKLVLVYSDQELRLFRMDSALKELVDQWLRQDPVSEYTSCIRAILRLAFTLPAQNEETRLEIEDLVKTGSIAELEKRMRYIST